GLRLAVMATRKDGGPASEALGGIHGRAAHQRLSSPEGLRASSRLRLCGKTGGRRHGYSLSPDSRVRDGCKSARGKCSSPRRSSSPTIASRAWLFVIGNPG